MAKKSARLSQPPPTAFERARDELYSHILSCGVLKAAPEHQKEWFDDTMDYIADRYSPLPEDDVEKLRELGKRFCQPVIQNKTVGAGSSS